MFHQLAINGLIASSIYAPVALGFTLVYRTVKFSDFAHGVISPDGAYLVYPLAIFLHNVSSKKPGIVG